jgi:tetratricopeptide repeat protein 21B
MLRAASLLARHPDRTDAAQDLIRAASVTESANSRLHYDIGRLLACFSSEPLSDLARLCYETAAQLDPRDAAVRTALADLILARGDVAGALQTYSAASQSDEGNAGALFGMIRCKIVRGQLDDAEHELDFLGEIQVWVFSCQNHR